MGKKKLSSAKWLWMFVGTLVLIAALMIGMNILVDPYGAFGDPILQWWGYDETMNPRMAKISYLEQHHEEYDSYIVGSSCTSSLPVSDLNEYLDASFYNCFFYGTSMYTYEKLCDYLLENYEVKNLVLNMSNRIAMSYGAPSRQDLSYSLHYKVSGESPWSFYSKYALINPADSLEKLKFYMTDPFLQQPYRVFEPVTGAYDKSRRDAEPISDLESYLARDAYKEFQGESATLVRLHDVQAAAESVGRIREKCEAMGVNLIVTVEPLYQRGFRCFDPDEVELLRNALAQVTDYWDFTLSSVSYDPRYFYDSAHFRNDVGRMALAKMFGNDSVYYPEDIGVYIPRGSSPEPIAAEPPAQEDYTAKVQILMYHDLYPDGDTEPGHVTASRFREHLTGLLEGGFHPISFDQLHAYVMEGAELPEKPILITFDDGYLNNYEIGYPILKELSVPAAFFPIGVSMGKDTYKDTGVPMNPHFSLEQAEEMVASGLITIGSHGYNIHEVEGRDPDPIRKGAWQREDETEAEYAAFLRQDCANMEQLLGVNPGILSYPESKHTEISEVILRECGYWLTLTTEERTNVVVRGLQQSTLQMGRFNANASYTGEDLVRFLEEKLG